MSPLEQLQLSAAARLDAAERLRYVPVTVTRPREKLTATMIQTKINNALRGLNAKNGRGGVSVFVGMPTAENDNQLPGPGLAVTLGIRVVENPLVSMGASGAQLSAEEVALIVLNELHQTNLGLNGAMLYAAANCLAPDTSSGAAVIYDCYLKMSLGLAAARRAPQPVIGGGETAVTISGEPGSTLDGDVVGEKGVGISGAGEIYYTTDGSYPTPSTGMLYTGEFAVEPGARVRAVAYMAGLSASNCAVRDYQSPKKTER